MNTQAPTIKPTATTCEGPRYVPITSLLFPVESEASIIQRFTGRQHFDDVDGGGDNERR